MDRPLPLHLSFALRLHAAGFDVLDADRNSIQIEAWELSADEIRRLASIVGGTLTVSPATDSNGVPVETHSVFRINGGIFRTYGCCSNVSASQFPAPISPTASVSPVVGEGEAVFAYRVVVTTANATPETTVAAANDSDAIKAAKAWTSAGIYDPDIDYVTIDIYSPTGELILGIDRFDVTF